MMYCSPFSNEQGKIPTEQHLDEMKWGFQHPLFATISMCCSQSKTCPYCPQNGVYSHNDVFINFSYADRRAVPAQQQ